MNNEDESGLDEELMALAAKLPTEAKPGRDLWPEIEQSITQPARHTRTAWNSVWAQAAAVVLLVGGSSGITYLAVKGDASYLGPVVGVDKIFEPVSGDFGATYTLGNSYLNARDQLEGGLDKKLDSLSPETRVDVLKNLETIRAAIKDINVSLAKEPDNVLLQELLLSTYHEEMSLMMKVDGIANSAMRREDI